jgi:hypothetical protein
MVNPSNNNPTRAVDQVAAANAAQAARQGSVGKAAGSAQDSAELSSVSKDLAVYVNALKNVPDVRPEAVNSAKRAINTSLKYPPLDVIEGIGKLVGELGPATDSSSEAS